eukprot:9685351-Ditylum_brightwellii.AAC.1
MRISCHVPVPTKACCMVFCLAALIEKTLEASFSTNCDTSTNRYTCSLAVSNRLGHCRFAVSLTHTALHQALLKSAGARSCKYVTSFSTVTSIVPGAMGSCTKYGAQAIGTRRH